MYNADRVGYYLVNGQKTFSKVHAIELQKSTGHHPEWIFNDEQFSNYDWTKEPEQTIWQIYANRARQLRQKYDYLVLMYSGGADSTNILQVFLDHDIPVDEICCWHTLRSTQKGDFSQHENKLVQLPVAKKICREKKWKYREIDLTDLTVKYFLDRKNRFDLVYDSDTLSPHHLGLVELRHGHNDWKRIAMSGKTIGLIRGIDKPRVYNENGKFYVRFIDNIINMQLESKTIRNGYDWAADEFFYWAPDMPDVLCKQAHLIKKFIEKGNKNTPGFTTKKSWWPAKIIDNVQYNLTEHCVHQIVYPYWNINTFSIGKFPEANASPRDRWFFQNPHLQEANHVYNMSLEAVSKIAGDYWLNDPNDPTFGLKGMWSKSYYLN